MGSGGRRSGARAVVAGALVALAVAAAGCSGTPDRARLLEGRLTQVDHVGSAEVTVPSTDRGGAIAVAYDPGAADPDSLATLISDVARVAATEDYAAYRLTLSPESEPDSRLVVDADFTGTGPQARVLTAWLDEVEDLLGPVRHVVDGAAQTITVDAGGATAHDLAAARRSGYGDEVTTWVFETGSGTFRASGPIVGTDLTLVQAVQRHAGSDDRPVWAEDWQLDRAAGHLRLDLELRFDGPAIAAAQLTVAAHSTAVAPVVRPSLATLLATGRPVWLRLHHDDGSGEGASDVFASWTSVQRAAPGRDPLGRGWDAWLAGQAREVGA